MDQFGIGTAVKGMMLNYTMSSRGTGRTTNLVDSLKTGDRVVFTNSNEARRVQRMAKERGVEIEIVVIDPGRPHDIFSYPTVRGEGRNIFDHSWVEEFYLNAIECAIKDLDSLERETSGYGAAHRETKSQAMERMRWNV